MYRGGSRSPSLYGTPEIFNTDQGSQFTGMEFTELLKEKGIAISMDGRGCWRDNVFVERLWKSIKYEEVYLHAYDSVSEARRGLERYLTFYNHSGHTQRLTDQHRMRSISDVGRRCPMRLNGNGGKASLIKRHPLSKHPGPALRSRLDASSIRLSPIFVWEIIPTIMFRIRPTARIYVRFSPIFVWEIIPTLISSRGISGIHPVSVPYSSGRSFQLSLAIISPAQAYKVSVPYSSGRSFQRL